MVQIRDSQLHTFNQVPDLEAWLSRVTSKLAYKDINLLRNACVLAQLAGEHEANWFGESCFHQGLVMVDILADLNVDQDTLAATMLHSSVQYADLQIADVNEHLGKSIMQLIDGVSKMDAANTLKYDSTSHNTDHGQIDRLRRMLLAMVEDVRVVLIKLAERIYLLRAAKVISGSERKALARETLDIYAPLASRLGVGQLKWELEDLAFRYLETSTYQNIATSLAQKRLEREAYVDHTISFLKTALDKNHIKNANVNGRAKHIYSIYRKMQRKNIDFDQIYDATAVRILVDSIEDCYTALSCVHSLWEHIGSEFDDYIATPKPNGYRSIHTAVKGPYHRNIEVQIRTYDMHNNAELGVAAHWIYKEGSLIKTGYEQKIAWLRQLLEWQSELGKENEPAETLRSQAFDDRIYVFTPAGHIVDLPAHATVLDFAYYIHSDIGHRCRGAKVFGKIVPLTHTLQTGEQIEIITGKQASPSRDWLSPHSGYLKSSRAKSKVHHWFKQQDYQRHLTEGEALYTRETRRLQLTQVDLNAIALQCNYKTKSDLIAALGAGDIRMPHLLSLLQKQIDATNAPSQSVDVIPPETTFSPQPQQLSTDITINGIGHLLTYIAKCCHPVPGDPIIGYITVGRGVTIHHIHCPNADQKDGKHKAERFVDVSWGKQTHKHYTVHIMLQAYDRAGLVRDVSQLVSAEKLPILSLSTTTHTSENTACIDMAINIYDINTLSHLLGKLQGLTGVYNVERKIPNKA